MNPSLSTVDSLLNVLPISRNTNVNVNLLNSFQRGATNQNTPPTTNSRLNSIELDRAIKAARSSPSFNDSEPPSYFEVVGSAGFISVPATTTAVNQADHDANRYSHVPVNFRQHPNRYQSHNVTNSKEFTNIANPTANISNNRTTRNLNLAASIYQQENEETTTTSTSSNGRGTLVDPVAVAASIYSTATASGRQRSSQSAYHNHHHRAHHKPSETYMVWSVFTTFYCVFIGIFALILSLQVRNLNRKGLFDKAYARSRAVWYLNIAGLFFGIVYLTIIILFCLFPKF